MSPDASAAWAQFWVALVGLPISLLIVVIAVFGPVLERRLRNIDEAAGRERLIEAALKANDETFDKFSEVVGEAWDASEAAREGRLQMKYFRHWWLALLQLGRRRAQVYVSALISEPDLVIPLTSIETQLIEAMKIVEAIPPYEAFEGLDSTSAEYAALSDRFSSLAINLRELSDFGIQTRRQMRKAAKQVVGRPANPSLFRLLFPRHGLVSVVAADTAGSADPMPPPVEQRP